MNCDCISRVNEKLKEQNLTLNVSIVFGDKMSTLNDTLTVDTHWLDKSKAKRGKKPTTILVTFCPFCGVKTERKPTTEPQSNEASQ